MKLPSTKMRKIADRKKFRDFPSDPVVQTALPLQRAWTGSLSDQGTKIPHAVWCGQKIKVRLVKAIVFPVVWM